MEDVLAFALALFAGLSEDAKTEILETMRRMETTPAGPAI